MKNFPKILIIGAPFNKKTGGGITMSNLFSNWPKSRIALASSANVPAEAELSICENYYQLSYNGKLHPFPLNVFLPVIKCGPLILNFSSENDNKIIQEPGKLRKAYNLLRSVLEFIGIFNILYKIRVTEDFKNWIKEFDPDIIYSQLSTYPSICLVSEVADLINKPIALHFMDDWINTMHSPSLFRPYWKKKINFELRTLIERSSILMSIGDAMSEEYSKRYKKNFIPFHNPIDIDNWLPFSKKDWSINDQFKILYAGRVGLGMKNSIVDIARVVNSLGDEFENVFFEILSPDIHEIEGSIQFSKHVKWTKPIPYSELPQKLSKADVLLLPIDFDKRSIQFLKFSFQTKISEYMITGTPVLIYGPEETSTVKYALKDEWAYVVSERDDTKIKDAILRLFLNPDLRMKLGQKAMNSAIENEDAVLVRQKFINCLSQFMS